MANVLDVTFEEVAASYEGTIPVQKADWVNTKIDEAVRELIAIIPNIPARIEAGTLDPDLVTDKVVGAVLRVVRNPTGIEQEGEGDYNYRLRNTVASGDIWYQEKDLVALGWIAPSTRAVARTVFTTPSRGFGFPG